MGGIKAEDCDLDDHLAVLQLGDWALLHGEVALLRGWRGQEAGGVSEKGAWEGKFQTKGKTKGEEGVAREGKRERARVCDVTKARSDWVRIKRFKKEARVEAEQRIEQKGEIEMRRAEERPQECSVVCNNRKQGVRLLFHNVLKGATAAVRRITLPMC